jgi:hypothetical protein
MTTNSPEQLKVIGKVFLAMGIVFLVITIAFLAIGLHGLSALSSVSTASITFLTLGIVFLIKSRRSDQPSTIPRWPAMTIRRCMWTFVVISLFAFALAALGHFVLPWPDDAVGTWAGIGGSFLFCALLIRLTPRWWRQHYDEMSARPASLRYQRAVIPIMAGYSLALFLSMSLIHRGIESVPLRALVAVTPALAIVLVIRVALRYWREIDELQRRIETEAIGVASLLVAVLYFAGGLLQVAKVIDVDAGVVMIWVFPLLCLTYGIAKIVLTKRYL